MKLLMVITVFILSGCSVMNGDSIKPSLAEGSSHVVQKIDDLNHPTCGFGW